MKFHRLPRGARRHGERGGLVPDFSSLDAAFGRSEKPDYHTAALCKLVLRVVSTTLSGECGDPVLQDLLVDSVVPAPNAGRMMVCIYSRDAEVSLVDILPRLEAVRGLLRSRIAEASVRKRVPELVFQVIPFSRGGGA